MLSFLPEIRFDSMALVVMMPIRSSSVGPLLTKSLRNGMVLFLGFGTSEMPVPQNMDP